MRTLEEWPLVSGFMVAFWATMLPLAIVVWLQSCGLKPVARTAVEAAKAACELFGEQAPPDVMGLSLDECVDHLLAGQRAGAGKP